MLPGVAEKGQKIGVELVAMGGGKAVRRAGVDLERGVLHDLRGEFGGIGDGNNLIVIAVDEERRDVYLFEILREIRLREGLDAIERALQSHLHALEPELIAQTLRDLRAGAIRAVKRSA